MIERNNQAIPYEQALGNCGQEELPFNWKKPPTEPGSGKGSHLTLATQRDQGLTMRETRQKFRNAVVAFKNIRSEKTGVEKKGSVHHGKSQSSLSLEVFRSTIKGRFRVT